MVKKFPPFALRADGFWLQKKKFNNHLDHDWTSPRTPAGKMNASASFSIEHCSPSEATARQPITTWPVL
jgi:hypothetical protein